MSNTPNIEMLPPSALNPQKRNPRTHSRRQIKQIARSIRQFGFTNPVLVDADANVVAGHGRLEAAKQLKLTEVPVIRLEGLSPEQVRAYIIADNKLAEEAGWDRKLLGLEFEAILDLNPSFDMTLTGFDLPEIDLAIQGLDGPVSNEADDVPQPPPGRPVTCVGDIWRLGPHRIICGDATDSETFKRLLEGERAGMVLTDAPYNVRINGHVGGHGKVKHEEFAMASGEMSEAEFIQFLRTVMTNLADNSRDGSLHLHFMDWGHIHEIMTAGRAVYSELKNLCVWAKTNGGMGSFYRSQHELVFVFKSGRAAHINNIHLGRYGRNRTNLWTYDGVNTFTPTRKKELASHPTVKPIQLMSDAILDCSNRSDIVLDAFGGSGTTLIAAEKTGRRGYLIELEPKYVDVTIERYQGLTGSRAIHAAFDISYDELKEMSTHQETVCA